MDGPGPHNESDQEYIISETDYHVYANTGVLFSDAYVLSRRLTSQKETVSRMQVKRHPFVYPAVCREKRCRVLNL